MEEERVDLSNRPATDYLSNAYRERVKDIETLPRLVVMCASSALYDDYAAEIDSHLKLERNSRPSVGDKWLAFKAARVYRGGDEIGQWTVDIFLID